VVYGEGKTVKRKERACWIEAKKDQCRSIQEYETKRAYPQRIGGYALFSFNTKSKISRVKS
jgi:hypothetical protein